MFVPIKIGSMCKHIFIHPFVLSVAKEEESWVCKLSKSLLSVANEHLMCSPKPLCSLSIGFEYEFDDFFLYTEMCIVLSQIYIVVKCEISWICCE